MAWRLRFGLCLGLLLSCTLATAQQCTLLVGATTPQSRFTIADETISDRRTLLEWQRCPIGFELSDNNTSSVLTDDRCELVATETFSWQQALQLVEDLNQAGGIGGHTDWRLPNIKELLSIVERQCVFPAINTTAFPDTSVTFPRIYWSSSIADSSNTRVLDFSTGEVSNYDGNRSTDLNLLRLVR